MLLGIRLQAKPTLYQKEVLSLWMGCVKSIWNAKCAEERYYTKFARKYYPIGTYAPIDQQYSQFKDKELTPWLYKVPSQILRNSVSNWYSTYKKFKKDICGKPRFKPKSDYGSVRLTRELFRFIKGIDGVTRLHIGTDKYNLGYLKVKNHAKYKKPNSIYIKKINGSYTVSFCYADGKDDKKLLEQRQHLQYLKNSNEKFLDKHIVGIDRGIARPIQCGDKYYDLTVNQQNNKNTKEKKLKYYQRKMARQKLDSKKRKVTKQNIAKCHQKISNIRNDFCHKSSHAIVSNPDNKIIILEDLKTKNLTKKPKAKQDNNGKWQRNGARAKAGLNKAILDVGWYKFESYIKYKSYKAGKAWFKVSANFTSQECANCGHTHPDNRKSQSKFVCDCCGNIENADRNAAMVIKKRAIKLLLHSGTELSKKGVLYNKELKLDIGRGATDKSLSANANNAGSNESSKKKRKVNISKIFA